MFPTTTWNSDGALATFSGNTYTYDALGRLTEVDNSIGKYLFSYDPLGRRVKKVDESPIGTVLATTSYHYDGSEVAVEYQPSTTYTYYLGLGIDQVVMRTDGTNLQWYYRDGHGSVSAVADNSGNLLEAYEYNAQGQFQITNTSGTVETGTQIANSILYTGRSYDAETGNYFYRARYYNPTLGRFISRDPLAGAEFSQGTNLYAYCSNNYLNEEDILGLAPRNVETTEQARANEAELVSDAVNTALSDMGQDPSSANITPGDANFANVGDPSAIDTSDFSSSYSTHADSTEASIPGSDYDLKIYTDPDTGKTTAAVVDPTNSINHFEDTAQYYTGAAVNAWIAKKFLDSHNKQKKSKKTKACHP